MKSETSVLDKKRVGALRVNVVFDDDPTDPRENDNIAFLCCDYGDYRLGDCSASKELDRILESLGYDCEELEYMEDGEKFRIFSEQDDIVWLPLSVYEHGGITMRCGYKSQFPDAQWDASNVGFAYITKEMAEKAGALNMSKDYPSWKDWAESCIRAEVEEYAAFLTGMIYAFEITDVCGDTIEYCGGFTEEEDAMEEGVYWAESINEQTEGKKQDTLGKLAHAFDEMGKDDFLLAICEAESCCAEELAEYLCGLCDK